MKTFQGINLLPPTSTVQNMQIGQPRLLARLLSQRAPATIRGLRIYRILIHCLRWFCSSAYWALYCSDFARCTKSSLLLAYSVCLKLPRLNECCLNTTLSVNHFNVLLLFRLHLYNHDHFQPNVAISLRCPVMSRCCLSSEMRVYCEFVVCLLKYLLTYLFLSCFIQHEWMDFEQTYNLEQQ